MNVAQWTRGVLETFRDEWFTTLRLHTEVESRSGESVNRKTLNRAVSRMVESGVVDSRWDESAPSYDSHIFGRFPGRTPDRRKEYRWV